MRRSWAYVLMIVATLAGGSALLWPLPPTVRIEEVYVPGAARPAPSPRPEAASSPRNKGASRAGSAAAAAKPEPPAVVKRFPVQNTSLKRLTPQPRPGENAGGVAVPSQAAPRPGAAMPPRPPAENRQ